MKPQPGDIVDVTIKGVRIVNHPAARLMRIADENGHVFDLPPQAAIQVIAPPEWPPRIGDLWRDRDGDLWFAFMGYDMDNDEFVNLHCTKSKPLDGWGDSTVYHVNQQYGPLALVHRETSAGGAR